MANEVKPNTTDGADETPVVESTPSPEKLRPGRRKFLALGLVAAPTILTLSNRSALGTGGGGGGFAVACTPSAALSLQVGTSLHGGGCNGRSPGYWKKCVDRGVGACGSLEFRTVFCGLWHSNGGLTWGTSPGMGSGGHPLPPIVPEDVTLCQVVNYGGVNGNPDAKEFGAHIVAAYFNSLSVHSDGSICGKITSDVTQYPMTPAAVRKMGCDIVATGFYNVGNGIVWNAEQVRAFIKGTFWG